MNEKTKRVLKRECLILAGIAIALFSLIMYYNSFPKVPHAYDDIAYQHKRFMGRLGFLINLLIFSYPLYLLIRLIILLVKTIKEKGFGYILVKCRKALQITFSKDVLIRILLVLGIIYLSVSIFKSCNTQKSAKYRPYLYRE